MCTQMCFRPGPKATAENQSLLSETACALQPYQEKEGEPLLPIFAKPQVGPLTDVNERSEVEKREREIKKEQKTGRERETQRET